MLNRCGVSRINGKYVAVMKLAFSSPLPVDDGRVVSEKESAESDNEGEKNDVKIQVGHAGSRETNRFGKKIRSRDRILNWRAGVLECGAYSWIKGCERV